MAILFVLASLGLPGLGNFIAEFLVLLGSFRVNVPLTVLATTGLVAATIYSLWIIQRVFHGEKQDDRSLPDFSNREMAIMIVMTIAIITLGLYPQPVFDTAGPALRYTVATHVEEPGKKPEKPLSGVEQPNGND